MSQIVLNCLIKIEKSMLVKVRVYYSGLVFLTNQFVFCIFSKFKYSRICVVPIEFFYYVKSPRFLSPRNFKCVFFSNYLYSYRYVSFRNFYWTDVGTWNVRVFFIDISIVWTTVITKFRFLLLSLKNSKMIKKKAFFLSNSRYFCKKHVFNLFIVHTISTLF